MIQYSKYDLLLIADIDINRSMVCSFPLILYVVGIGDCFPEIIYPYYHLVKVYSTPALACFFSIIFLDIDSSQQPTNSRLSGRVKYLSHENRH